MEDPSPISIFDKKKPQLAQNPTKKSCLVRLILFSGGQKPNIKWFLGLRRVKRVNQLQPKWAGVFRKDMNL